MTRWSFLPVKNVISILLSNRASVMLVNLGGGNRSGRSGAWLELIDSIKCPWKKKERNNLTFWSCYTNKNAKNGFIILKVFDWSLISMLSARCFNFLMDLVFLFPKEMMVVEGIIRLLLLQVKKWHNFHNSMMNTPSC